MLDPLRINSLSKAETKKNVLYKKNRRFGDNKLSARYR